VRCFNMVFSLRFGLSIKRINRELYSIARSILQSLYVVLTDKGSTCFAALLA
jgi:hypothetical protein